MADGSRAFNFPMPQRSRLRPGEIVVDLFAGGGGASEGLKQALGIDPALAYNHDELAIGMHAANHPLTQHHREDIWHADPRVDVAGRPIGWFHASPDCTHFSQAKGGQPRSRKTRALSWVVLKWVGQLLRADRLHGTNTAPRIISMENVWQILTWGPLVAKRCKTTGRVIKMDGTVAARGERVPVENQQLVPDKRHSGRTWQQFVAALRALGYVVEWRKLVASDYGAGTSRERLFLLGRRDGQAIVWPEPSHGSAPGQKPRVTAADCLDFSIPCPSIFGRKRDLADATMRRIAKGVMRHVLQSAEPFLVPVPPTCRDNSSAAAAFIAEHANSSHALGSMRADEPLRTVCAGVKGGHFSVVSPILAGVGGRAGQSEPRSGGEPLYTMTTKADTALVAPTLVQTGYGEREGQAPRALDLQQPLGTIVAGGVKHAVAAPRLVKFRGDSIGTAATEPVPTITSGAGAARPAGAAHALGVSAAFMVQAAHGEGRPNGPKRWGIGSKDARSPIGTVTASGNGGHALAEAELAQLSPVQEAGALRVAAFMVKYYGTGANAPALRNPVDTITTRDRLALVTVVIKGTPYVIVDIGLRMLKPHELFRAQGFPSTYIIDRTADGTTLKTTAQVRMCGNSVSPPPMFAIADANLDPVPADLAVAA
ncbi:DNA cytosine methyltransferase [Stenotrophomonas maltophilia]|uniref:DNA cytosine methyltransferase n=1 Tax=Stenotrophomonas maltophilia TaxID=40324 RepID=UPI001F539B78|nr:DNA cytosine methyltransferase [Stenotrophomonas maltophilia]MCI1139738.1 DNA cytosine methyltransferase [Stenotrophomonas maltophilia]